MRTKEQLELTTKKQNELKYWLKKLGLSQEEFLQYYLEEVRGYGFEKDDPELKSEASKFKKYLQRPTTPPEKLDKYLDCLFAMERFRDGGYVRPTYISSGVLPPKIEALMWGISQELSEKLISDRHAEIDQEDVGYKGGE